MGNGDAGQEQALPFTEQEQRPVRFSHCPKLVSNLKNETAENACQRHTQYKFPVPRRNAPCQQPSPCHDKSAKRPCCDIGRRAAERITYIDGYPPAEYGEDDQGQQAQKGFSALEAGQPGPAEIKCDTEDNGRIVLLYPLQVRQV